MSVQILALVLVSAFMHAGWNALVKTAGDRVTAMAAIATAHAVAGLVASFFLPLPSWQALPWLAASTFCHYLYLALLAQAYRFGDLSQVYPLSRGMAPLLVTLGAFFIIGERLDMAGLAGLAAISLGILVLTADSRRNASSWAGFTFAAMLGLTIACYSVVDGIGVRSSDEPMSYIAWLFLLQMPYALSVAVRQKRKGAFSRRDLQLGLAGGALSVIAYAIVLLAKTIAPLGAVSAIRESSVIIAALVGLIAFGERPVGIRLLAAGCVMVGVLCFTISS